MSQAPTEHESALLTGLNIAMGSISMCGSLFIILCFLKFKELRSFAFRLILNVAVSDFLASIGALMGDRRSGPSCKFQAILTSGCQLSSVLWTVAIAFTLHMAFLREDETFSPSQIRRHVFKFYICCVGFPVVLSVLPFTTDSYGDAGGWCWIVDHDTASKTWRFVQFYVPLWLSVMYSVWVYVLVVRKLNRIEEVALASGNTVDDERLKTVKVMRYYPLMLILCYFWATFNRVFQVCGGGFVLWITAVHVVFAGALGFANAFVYGTTPKVQNRIRLFLYPYCPCIALKSSAPSVGARQDEDIDAQYGGHDSGSYEPASLSSAIGASNISIPISLEAEPVA